MKRTRYFYKAQPTLGDQEVPTTVITFEDCVPHHNTLEAMAREYEEQGKALADTLFEILPGGTVDALLRHMMEKRASLFRVHFGQ